MSRKVLPEGVFLLLPGDSTDDDDLWVRHRCYTCGHHLRFRATCCPQCNERFDGRASPAVYPVTCRCLRCAGVSAPGGSA